MPAGNRGSGPTRDRILALLRRGPGTVEDLSRDVGVTPNSIRVQLSTLERDGLVRREGLQRRARKPANLYALSADAERAFSNAYVPLLAGLLEVLGDRLGAEATTSVLAEVGHRLGRSASRPGVEREVRIRDALGFLTKLGSVAEVDERDDGRIVIRGLGCPLGEVVQKDARVCAAMQALLAEVVGAPVRESCERGGRPACRFEIDDRTP